jgi:anti-sigma28 factor (negative regulator of flagellin synthesis)
MNLLEAITNGYYRIADELLNEEMDMIVYVKLNESKKRIACDYAGEVYKQTERQRRLFNGVLEDKEEPKVAQSTEQEVSEDTELQEGRIRLIKARIRGGKLQRKKLVSNVQGFTLRAGKLTKMSPAERRHRKLGAMKAARKTKLKKSTSLRKRKMSLMKRKRSGI